MISMNHVWSVRSVRQNQKYNYHAKLVGSLIAGSGCTVYGALLVMRNGGELVHQSIMVVQECQGSLVVESKANSTLVCMENVS